MKQVSFTNSTLQQLAAQEDSEGHPEICTHEIYSKTDMMSEPMPH